MVEMAPASSKPATCVLKKRLTHELMEAIHAQT